MTSENFPTPQGPAELPAPLSPGDRRLDRDELAGALAIAWRELERLRRIIAERSAQLASVQTEVFNLRRDARQLGASSEEVARLENELNSLRYRVHDAEATLARFRCSFSWRVTKPLRWIGRQLRLNGLVTRR